MNNYEFSVTNFKPKKEEGDFLATEATAAVSLSADTKQEKNENIENILSADEILAIRLRSDLRRRGQELKINLVNLQQPGSTEAMKTVYGNTITRVYQETNNENPLDIPINEAGEKINDLEQKIQRTEELFPNLAAFYSAQVVKLKLHQGDIPNQEITQTKNHLAAGQNLPKISPASLLPDAMLLGAQKILAEKNLLPPKEKIAQAVVADKKLLTDYALVLPEADRADFLALLPDETRRKISIFFDENTASVLHQSVIEKTSPEDKQRKAVRLRAYQELKQVMADKKNSDKIIAAALARTMGRLGGDTRLLLLELANEEMEHKGTAIKNGGQDYLPHLMGVMMKNFDDFRVNDLALKLVGDLATPPAVASNLFHKLIKRGYLPANAGEWWNEHAPQLADSKKLHASRDKKLEILQKVIADLGVMPSKDILSFLDDDKKWQGKSLDERIAVIRLSQEEFNQAKSQSEIVQLLTQDRHKAMIYYLLHGGDDRFNLINNYSFEKFQEMLGLIKELTVHKAPLKKFTEILERDVSRPEVLKITDNLRAGRFPLERVGQDYQEASFEVSENAAVKNANTEIGHVLGREQLGVVLLFPVYREYLEQTNSQLAQGFLEKMPAAATFADRLLLLNEIESAYPAFQLKAKAELEDNWKVLGEKMVLETSLDQVFNDSLVPARGEELIPRLNSKRLDLKRMKKDLLVALKGGNEKLDSLQKNLYQKKRARSQLVIGLDKQNEEARRTDIQTKLNRLDKKIGDLEQQKAILNDVKVSERFDHLTKEAKTAEIERIGQEIIALTEKSPSAIFTYLTAQVLGEEKLREQDIQLIQEMESHLQGPFQTISDSLTYQSSGRENKKNVGVGLQYLNKTERLMNMVRFADSKICCFSSNNYEMQVAHGTANKYWVASINADPMSFVISMEIPQEELLEQDQQKKSVENLGFIFGSFAIDQNDQLAIMLNGLYYAPGIENEKQVDAIMEKVQKMFKGLPIKTVAIASQHGGSIKMPAGYANTPVELTRLRALDNGNGRPETKIYDDIGTNESLNQPKIYNAGGSGNLWHKKV